MGSILLRCIEIKKNNLKGYIHTQKDLSKLNPEKGDLYCFIYENSIFKEWNGSDWVNSSKKEWWVQLDWNKKENNVFYDTGGSLKTFYLSKLSPYKNILDRGIPDDSNQELREYLNNNGDYHTWVLLSELSFIYEIELERLKQKLKLSTVDEEINKRLSRLEKAVLNINLSSIEESFNEVFDNEIETIQSLYREINIIRFLSENFGDVWKEEDIRINYFIEW